MLDVGGSIPPVSTINGEFMDEVTDDVGLAVDFVCRGIEEWEARELSERILKSADTCELFEILELLVRWWVSNSREAFESAFSDA